MEVSCYNYLKKIVLTRLTSLFNEFYDSTNQCKIKWNQLDKSVNSGELFRLSHIDY